MSKPNSTKRIPRTRLDKVVMVRDESDEAELLAFENEYAADLFEACLGDSGYGSAYGGYEVERLDMEVVRQTQGYQTWLTDSRKVISLRYMQYVSDRMDRNINLDVSGDLLNMAEVSHAYVPMTGADFELLYDEECEEVE